MSREIGRQPPLVANPMKYSISHLLLIVALFATGIGWWLDRTRLSVANERLNMEAAELFEQWTFLHPHPNFQEGDSLTARAYSFTNSEDRAAYRELLSIAD